VRSADIQPRHRKQNRQSDFIAASESCFCYHSFLRVLGVSVVNSFFKQDRRTAGGFDPVYLLA